MLVHLSYCENTLGQGGAFDFVLVGPGIPFVPRHYLIRSHRPKLTLDPRLRLLHREPRRGSPRGGQRQLKSDNRRTRADQRSRQRHLESVFLHSCSSETSSHGGFASGVAPPVWRECVQRGVITRSVHSKTETVFSSRYPCLISRCTSGTDHRLVISVPSCFVSSPANVLTSTPPPL